MDNEILQIIWGLTRHSAVKVTFLPSSGGEHDKDFLTVKMEFSRNGMPYCCQIVIPKNDLFIYSRNPQILAEFRKVERQIKYGDYP